MEEKKSPQIYRTNKIDPDEIKSNSDSLFFLLFVVNFDYFIPIRELVRTLESLVVSKTIQIEIGIVIGIECSEPIRSIPITISIPIPM